MHPIKAFCKKNKLSYAKFVQPLSCGSEYISQIICGYRQGSPQLALEIERAWKLPAFLIRPDIFQPPDQRENNKAQDTVTP